MKYLSNSCIAITVAFSLVGCSVSTQTAYYNTPTYSPAYNTDYVYSVGYYGYRPAYNGISYGGHTWGNPYWYGNRPYTTYTFGHTWY